MVCLHNWNMWRIVLFTAENRSTKPQTQQEFDALLCLRWLALTMGALFCLGHRRLGTVRLVVVVVGVQKLLWRV